MGIFPAPRSHQSYISLQIWLSDRTDQILKTLCGFRKPLIYWTLCFCVKPTQKNNLHIIIIILFYYFYLWE